MRACARAGLRVPEVLSDDDGAHLGTTGLVMRARPGRDDRPPHPPRRRVRRGPPGAGGRPRRASSPVCTPSIRRRCPGSRPRIRSGRSGRSTSGSTTGAPPSKRAHDWLVSHRPPHTADALIHGDLRMGNVIVGPTGLAGGHRLGADPPRRPARGPRLAVPQGLAVRCAARGRWARNDRRARRRLRGGRWPARRPRRAALVARREDAHLGHRLHAPGRLSTCRAACARWSWRPSAAASPNRSGTSSSCSRPMPAAPRSRRTATRATTRRRRGRTGARPPASSSTPCAASWPTR